MREIYCVLTLAPHGVSELAGRARLLLGLVRLARALPAVCRPHRPARRRARHLHVPCPRTAILTAVRARMRDPVQRAAVAAAAAAAAASSSMTMTTQTHTHTHTHKHVPFDASLGGQQKDAGSTPDRSGDSAAAESADGDEDDPAPVVRVREQQRLIHVTSARRAARASHRTSTVERERARRARARARGTRDLFIQFSERVRARARRTHTAQHARTARPQHSTRAVVTARPMAPWG